MVQFVFTPWRNRAELLKVRGQFYPSATITSDSTTAYSPSDLQAIQKAVARVFMWVHRGHCPHVVESTAMLMSAVVLDSRQQQRQQKRQRQRQRQRRQHSNTDDVDAGEEDDSAAAAAAAAAAADADADADADAEAEAAIEYGIRAAYLTAFTRFVTGLLDGHQDKARKLSMYGVARTVGLPAGFVELRHQGTHEAMPGLAQLRPAAGRALRWIWEYYWRNLPDDGDEGGDGGGGEGVEGKEVAGGEQHHPVTAFAAAAAAVGAGEEGSASSGAATSGIRERMCKRAVMGYLQRQDGEAGTEAAREALVRQLGQWEDLLVVRALAEIGETARDSGTLARLVRLSREILGRATGTGVQDDAEMATDDIEGLRGELSRSRRELESMRESGKRKRDSDEQDGPGWKRWEGPWTPRPIGVL
ncbi:hypothetical protein VPNG_02446 [Cytospora leucostoma]|uniref:Uncharacterized protein n=1 Tax=Cytospora leucostoma TaxID=1230097 RepID=A0A423XI55_9PEZI|nr:hypothetical protein VPNG_02446 [Cytospora leucostoma]